MNEELTGNKLEKASEPIKRDALGRLIPGQRSLNPKGRPKGRSYTQMYADALQDYAESEGKTPEDVENILMKVALKRAAAGDYKFYRDIMDRLHGKPEQRLGGSTDNPLEIIVSDVAAKKYGLNTSTKDNS